MPDFEKAMTDSTWLSSNNRARMVENVMGRNKVYELISAGPPHGKHAALV